jgi:signal transduction histidine kinase
LAVIVIRRYIAVKQDLFESNARAELEKTKATLTERQRIMTDIHDIVGAQLVGVLDLIRTGAPREQLEAETTEALEDLRIAIDAIQPVNGSLTAVLATLRHRLEPRLNARDIQLMWHVEALPRLANLTPQTIQHLQRLVLEAISNVMKHANARAITFKAQSIYEGRTVVIQISDDGIGFDEATLTSAGQGLRNMRFRADAVGATLSISRALPHGTNLSLILPIG